MCDQPFEVDATHTTQTKQERRKSMLSAEFETVIPVLERLQDYALDHTATEMTLNLP